LEEIALFLLTVPEYALVMIYRATGVLKDFANSHSVLSTKNAG
jgi:hypothetical protein